MRRVELVGLVGLAGLYGLGWSGVAESWWVVWGEGVCVSVCMRMRETVCMRERERREEGGRESGREKGGRVREKEVVGVGMDHNGACHPHVLVGVSGQSQGHKGQGTKHNNTRHKAQGHCQGVGMGMGWGWGWGRVEVESQGGGGGRGVRKDKGKSAPQTVLPSSLSISPSRPLSAWVCD